MPVPRRRWSRSRSARPAHRRWRSSRPRPARSSFGRRRAVLGGSIFQASCALELVERHQRGRRTRRAVRAAPSLMAMLRLAAGLGRVELRSSRCAGPGGRRRAARRRRAAPATGRSSWPLTLVVQRRVERARPTARRSRSRRRAARTSASRRRSASPIGTRVAICAITPTSRRSALNSPPVIGSPAPSGASSSAQMSPCGQRMPSPVRKPKRLQRELDAVSLVAPPSRRPSTCSKASGSTPWPRRSATARSARSTVALARLAVLQLDPGAQRAVALAQLERQRRRGGAARVTSARGRSA